MPPTKPTNSTKPPKVTHLFLVIALFLAVIVLTYMWLAYQLVTALYIAPAPAALPVPPYTQTAANPCGEWAAYQAKAGVLICAPHGKDLGAGIKSNWEVK